MFRIADQRTLSLAGAVVLFAGLVIFGTWWLFQINFDPRWSWLGWSCYIFAAGGLIASAIRFRSKGAR